MGGHHERGAAERDDPLDVLDVSECDRAGEQPQPGAAETKHPGVPVATTPERERQHARRNDRHEEQRVKPRVGAEDGGQHGEENHGDRRERTVDRAEAG